MKIVSKYKDFYDFFTGDYDADIVYVREPVVVHTNYCDFYEDNSGKFLSDRNRYLSPIGSNREIKKEDFRPLLVSDVE